MAEAFTWGPGGDAETTSSRARRRLAEALMMEGTSTAPIQHWTQGLNRIAQALVGGYELSKEDERDRQQAADAQAIISSHPAFAAATPGVAKVASALTGSSAPQGDAASAIANIESGGKYDLLGPVTKTGDRAYGKYQVMGANVPQWTKAHLGQAMTPEQYLASPEAQDAVFKGQFGQYTQKYGPEGAARAWFAGEGGMNNPNARDQLGTTVQAYADRFNKVYQPTPTAEATLPTNAQPAQGYAIPGQAAAPVAGPRMAPGVSAWVQRAIRDPATRAAGLAVLNNYAKPQETFQQVTDDQGNVWNVNNLTGQRTVALKKEEGAGRPITPEERKAYGIPDNIPVMMTDRGPKAISTGGTTVNNNLGGGSDKQIFDEFVERSKAARATAQGLSALRTARAAIDAGAITGFRADNRLQLQKAASLFGIAEPEKIQNSEVFKAAIAPQVAAVLKATVGNANISDSDRRFAERAAGGSLDLDEGSIKKLLDIMEKASVAQLQDHQEALDAVYPDPNTHKRERALFGIKVPTGAMPPAGATKSGIKWSVE